MSGSLCRLSVRTCAAASHADGVDLALPRDMRVDLLMPLIVDIVHDREERTDVSYWLLSRLGGYPLDESLTLCENEIRDGDILLLSAPDPAPAAWTRHDPGTVTARVARDMAGSVPRVVAACGACVYFAFAGACALVWSGLAARTAGHVVAAVGMAVGAAAGAATARMLWSSRWPGVALGAVAIVFSTAAGLLAVPSPLSYPSLVVAASAAFAMAIVLMRVTGSWTTPLTAVAVPAALTAAVAAAAMTWMWPAATTGAALTLLALGALAVAARASITLAGLAPAVPTADTASGETRDARLEQIRARRARRLLTGMVFGLSAAAAAGAVFVMSGVLCGETAWTRAVAFTAVVGVALLMRSRVHVDAYRRAALLAGGAIGATACLVMVVVALPGQALWSSVLAATVGTATLASASHTPSGPLLSRAVAMLDYVSLAAVPPLGCWLCGLYELVRGTSLT